MHTIINYLSRRQSLLENDFYILILFEESCHASYFISDLSFVSQEVDVKRWLHGDRGRVMRSL